MTTTPGLPGTPSRNRSVATRGPRILVPIERCAESRAAFRQARELAGWLGAGIDLLHVLDLEDFLPADRNLDQPMRSEADLRQWLELEADFPLRCWIELGDPRQQIVARARDGRYAAMVLGTRGRQGLLRMLAGSVTEAVLRQAPCPVMTVHAEGRVAASGPSLAATSASAAGVPTSVLCAVDMSGMSDRVIAHADALRRSAGAALTIVHVTPLEDGQVPRGEPPGWEALRARFALDATVKLELRAGDPAAELVSALERTPHRVLVMGTHQRSGLDRLLLGSVAEDVIRVAERPVLVVPASAGLPAAPSA
jgi:nucleotide-binding universal stress UspA family protein